MNELKTELQDLQKLDQSALDDAQKARLAELPGLIIVEADKLSALLTEKEKEAKTALAQKDHFRTQAEKAEADRVEAERKLKEAGGGAGNTGIDVNQFLDMSASLEGLDQAEKEYLANQHKLTGKPISELRQSDTFSFWQVGHKQKVEKDKALNPSSTQVVVDEKKSVDEILANATLEEKEKFLKDNGLYTDTRNKNHNRVNIGTQR